MAAKRFAYSQQWADIDLKLEWSGGRNRPGDRNSGNGEVGTGRGDRNTGNGEVGTGRRDRNRPGNAEVHGYRSEGHTWQGWDRYGA